MGSDDSAREGKAPVIQPVGQGNHTVREGEGLALIAAEAGHFWKTLWDHPANAELRRVRGNPETLLPGDKVTVPPLGQKTVAAGTGATHVFHRKGIPVKLTYVLKDTQGQALAGKAYSLQVGKQVFEGRTDPGGRISHWVQPTVARGDLIVWPETEGLPAELAWPVIIGQLSPVNSVRGLLARLSNLGYATGPVGDELGPRAVAALRDFQEDAGLTVTGEVDTPTVDAVRASYGA